MLLYTCILPSSHPSGSGGRCCINAPGGRCVCTHSLIRWQHFSVCVTNVAILPLSYLSGTGGRCCRNAPGRRRVCTHSPGGNTFQYMCVTNVAIVPPSDIRSSILALRVRFIYGIIRQSFSYFNNFCIIQYTAVRGAIFICDNYGKMWNDF